MYVRMCVYFTFLHLRSEFIHPACHGEGLSQKFGGTRSYRLLPFPQSSLLDTIKMANGLVRVHRIMTALKWGVINDCCHSVIIDTRVTLYLSLVASSDIVSSVISCLSIATHRSEY
jgi:hypothetical protein